jgi:hypothetical protein
MSHQLRKAVGLSILLATLPAIAQNSESNGEGIAAFKAGNYQQALVHFQQAERSGSSSDSLDYNIAVSLYRLGRFNEAKERFRTIADKPDWQVLVRYNLGLVAEAQNDRAEAIQLFRLSVQQQVNERVAALAQQKLNSFATQNPGPALAVNATPKRWASLISLSGGTDSNASSLADDLLDSRNSAEDSFHELLLYGHYQIVGRQGDGMRIYALGFDRSFTMFEHINSRVLGVGATYEKPIGSFLFETGLRATSTTLDTRDVATQSQFNIGVSRQFAIGNLKANIAVSQFDASDEFAQIDGDQQLTELTWRKQFGSVSLRGRYRFETNSRENLTRANAFSSYSPDRQGLLLETRWQASKNLNFTLSAEQIDSSHDEANRLRDTDGKIREEMRETTQSKWTVDASYRFNRHVRAKVEYQYTDQRDNFDIYAYDKDRVMGSIELQF